MTADQVEVRRSARRTRTLSVTREAGRLVVVIPAWMSAAQERAQVPGLVERFLRKEASRRLPADDAALKSRAERLYAAHLETETGPPPSYSIRWVDNQRRRWGSCTPATGAIRLSSRLRELPDWVGDSVIVHELVHLFETRHSTRFKALAGRYPEHARAEAFLEGFERGAGLSEDG